jgi:hypothetical protein
MADHFTFTYGIPGWTLELEPATGGQDYPGGLASHGHSGFILPDAEAARMREDVARQYLLGFYRQSGPPAAIAAEIRAQPGNGVVYRAQWTRSGAGARVLAVEVNEALVPGGTYRLWVAFNKPMRVRDSSGDVVPYAGQGTGAAVGPVTLEIPALADEIALGGGTWLNAPGGAPDGYLRYADDAFAVDFTLPESIEADAAIPAVLVLDPLDLAEMALDADPATAADWDGGHWVRYEDSEGTDGDTGGADCSFKPFVAPEAGAAAPAEVAACGAAEPPPPPSPPPPDRGGGGDGSGLLLMLMGLILILSTPRFAVRQGFDSHSGHFVF